MFCEGSKHKDCDKDLTRRKEKLRYNLEEENLEGETDE